MDLFSSGEPRWIGVRVNQPGEIEQPRVLLASVPYALKSVDAETLGGKPASAYLLAGAATNGGSGVPPGAGTSSTTSAGSAAALPVLQPRATNGTPGYIGVFTDPGDIGNSNIFQSGRATPENLLDGFCWFNNGRIQGE